MFLQSKKKPKKQTKTVLLQNTNQLFCVFTLLAVIKFLVEGYKAK